MSFYRNEKRADPRHFSVKTAIHWSPVIDDIAADVPAAFSN
jgi:hypothetical protein